MTSYAERLEAERGHYNLLRGRASKVSLRMSEATLRRYRSPSCSTAYPLEFAFHLLGTSQGDTVLELGCGDGLNTVVLAALGAFVVAIDISEGNLEVARGRLRANDLESRVQFVHGDVCNLPISDRGIDKVFGIAILHHVDPSHAGLEIRRVLKPRGIAVFSEPMATPVALRPIKGLIAGREATPHERPLSDSDVSGVIRSIGCLVSRREFGLSVRLVDRLGPESWAAIARQFDRWLLGTIPFSRRFASPIVWKVAKPS